MTIFVTGTATNIGKTFVTALLVGCLSSKYNKIAVVKPIESGVVKSSKSALNSIKKILKKKSDKVDFYNFVTFKQPVAPFTASLINKKPIDFNMIVKNINHLKGKYDLVVIEGAGGLKVPITKKLQMIDLIKKIKADVILVTSPSLGTINHTLLSYEALKRMKIKFRGIIINNYPKKPNISEIYNPIIISQNNVKILGLVPRFSSSDSKKSKINYKNFFDPSLNGTFNLKNFLQTCNLKFSKISNKVS